ncbi:MATE family efflux transporter [Leptospira semungkisensis]|uniref:Multidrug-efflux transporter n=1 Tax=Leptospira semungkisensis TaxID=2484985 RepID=A0A4V3JCU4_9LEPT|nr:MATE family efflux transporter [Leptospira semungkisensis]TGK07449.1 MATE family efflux transporter [Leptospira semungkisensis]
MDHFYKKIRRSYRASRLNVKILSLALPVVFGMLSQSLVWITDTIMIGYLGQNAIAAVGIAGTSYYTLIAFLIGFSMGVQIIVARRFGEGRKDQIGKVGITTVYLSLFLGSMLSFLGPIISQPLMNLIGPDITVNSLASEYLFFRSIGSGFYFLGFCFRGFLDGLGFTKAGFVSMAVTTLANIFFNWIFIYGNLGSDAMGIGGAGLASSLAGLAGLLVFPIFFFYYRVNEYFKEISLFPSWEHLKEIIKVGTPPGFEEGFVNVAFVLFAKIQGMISVIAIAASNVLFSTLSFAFLPGYAFGVAATTILGQAMGAKKYKLAYHSAFRSAFISAHVMGLIGLCFIFLGKQIIELITHDPALIEECYPVLALIGVIQIGDAYHMVIGAALRGAGMQTYVFRIYILLTYLLMLPSAYLFGIVWKGGTFGIWGGIFIWIASLSIVFVYEFRKKNWVKGTV